MIKLKEPSSPPSLAQEFHVVLPSTSEVPLSLSHSLSALLYLSWGWPVGMGGGDRCISRGAITVAWAERLFEGWAYFAVCAHRVYSKRAPSEGPLVEYASCSDTHHKVPASLTAAPIGPLMSLLAIGPSRLANKAPYDVCHSLTICCLSEQLGTTIIYDAQQAYLCKVHTKGVNDFHKWNRQNKDEQYIFLRLRFFPYNIRV